MKNSQTIKEFCLYLVIFLVSGIIFNGLAEIINVVIFRVVDSKELFLSRIVSSYLNSLILTIILYLKK